MSHIYQCLIVLLLLINGLTCHAEEPSSQENLSENTLIIRQVLQEFNNTVFSPRSLHITLLKGCPEMIPILAEWEYQEWHRYSASLTIEKLVAGFNQRLNDDRLPLTFVVLKGTTPVGVISLENHFEPELSDLADGNPWGDSFIVTPEERNKGLGEELAKMAVIVAKQLGYRTIHFYTSNSKNVRWYVERGAEVIETRPYRGHVITVMKFSLSS